MKGQEQKKKKKLLHEKDTYIIMGSSEKLRCIQFSNVKKSSTKLKVGRYKYVQIVCIMPILYKLCIYLT